MSYDNLGQSLKARIASWHLRKKFFWILGIALLSFIVWLLVILYYPYSEGTRTGVIRKLSHKGYIFKTWEGELQMSGIPVPSDANQVVTGGNVWSFSVDASNGEVIQALQKAESSGGRVTLHYIERLKQFDWRGDTKYFVKRVQ
jgi:hypothetical protein